MTIPTELQAILRAAVSARATRVGPFTVTIDPDATGLFRNYAIPDDGADPTAADVAALLGFFVVNDRLPRLEFVAPAPTAEQALDAAGFTVAQRFSLLVLADPTDLVPVAPPDGIRLDRPTTDSQLRAVATMQNAAYGEPGVSAADVDRLRRGLDNGADVVAGYDGGQVVGAGQLAAARSGFAELHAVATAESHRRRGVASAVAAELSAGAAPRSVVPFLQAEGAVEQRMYSARGYRTVGELVDMRGPITADHGQPRITADESQTLLAFLDYLRTAVARKVIGLGEDDARRSVVPSGTNLLWLAKHVAGVEAFWLHHLFAGDPEETIPDDEDLSADTVGSVLSLLRNGGRRTAQIVVEHPDLDELSGTNSFVPVASSLRWTLTHLIEETGRHAGHADVLRELIDGTVGR
ncbi:MAG: DUF664 domain-containing protein [Actinomycetota bacterium]|nr:DUF664 domain-containing protein [Actinomycetota bacterium]